MYLDFHLVGGHLYSAGRNYILPFFFSASPTSFAFFFSVSRCLFSAVMILRSSISSVQYKWTPASIFISLMRIGMRGTSSAKAAENERFLGPFSNPATVTSILVDASACERHKFAFAVSRSTAKKIENVLFSAGVDRRHPSSTMCFFDTERPLHSTAFAKQVFLLA